MISTILALGFATVAAATNAVEVLPMYTTAAAAEATGAMMAQQAYGSGGGEVVQPTSTSADIYSAMPYQTMQAGGYKQLQCGYGWAKDSNGKCVQQSWVSRRFSMPGALVMILFPACSTRCRAATVRSSSTSAFQASDPVDET